MIWPSAVRCPLHRAAAVLVGRERSPGTVASSDTAGPAATTSRPGSSQMWIKGSGFFLYSLQPLWLFCLEICSSVPACMPDVLAVGFLGEHSTGDSLSFLGLSGYRYCVFSSLRPALLKYICRYGYYKKQLFQRQTSSNCLHHLFSVSLGHP